jgi:gliding motility-associated protein GldE
MNNSGSDLYSAALNYFTLVDDAFSFNNLIKVIVIMILLFLSALFSAGQVAFFSLSPADLDRIKQSASKTDLLIIELLDNPKKLLATLLITDNMLNVSIIIITSLIHFFNYHNHTLIGFVFQVVLITFIIVLFAEVIPKVYSTKHNVKVLRIMIFPIYALNKFFAPFSYILVSSTKIIEKRFIKKSYHVNIDELTHAIDITSDKNTPEDEKKILKGIVKFGNIDVKQIMKSRMDTIAYEDTTKFKVLLSGILESGYSRIPIYKEDFDTIVGIIYIKDLLAFLDESDDFNWQQLIRPPYFVPESKKINDLLQEFQLKKIHLAIVVDEYGGSSGIVTLEDILEEIVGEINDEFDDDELIYSKLDERNFVFEGKTLINDICRVLNIDRKIFVLVEGDSDTLAGLVLELKGNIPERGNKVEHGGYTFTVEAVDKRRIKRVKITIPEKTIELPDEDIEA